MEGPKADPPVRGLSPRARQRCWLCRVEAFCSLGQGGGLAVLSSLARSAQQLWPGQGWRWEEAAPLSLVPPTRVLCCPPTPTRQPKPQLPAVSQAGAWGLSPGPRGRRERGEGRAALTQQPPQPAPPPLWGSVPPSVPPGSEFSDEGMRERLRARTVGEPWSHQPPHGAGQLGGGVEAGQPWGLLGLVQPPLQAARVSALLPALSGGAPSYWSPTLPGPAALLIPALAPTLCLGWRGELGGSQQEQPPRNMGLLQGGLC